MSMSERKLELCSWDDFFSFTHQIKQFYIYGAGKVAKELFKRIPVDNFSHFAGFIVTEKENNPDFLGGFRVNSLNNIDISIESYIIVGVGNRYRERILNLLKEKGYQKIFLVKGDLEKECIYDRREKIYKEIDRCLWRITPHPFLNHLVVDLVDHCNLNCRGCDHFAPVAKKYEIPVDVVIRDLKRMQELLPERIQKIWLTGGEPLLHPHISKIIQATREIFPEHFIAVLTNGTLLTRQNTSFWQICHNSNVQIQVTKYPIQFDYNEAEKIAQQHRVKYVYYAGGTATKTLYHIPLDVHGKQDPVDNFLHCSHAQECTMLKNGKLYPCTVAPSLSIFNKAFDYHIPLTELDGINIFKVKNGDEIMEKLSRPMSVCRFCNIKGRTEGHPWETSKKNIEEWT